MKSIVDSKVLHKAIQKAINQNNIKVVVTPTLLKLGKVKVKLESSSDFIGYSEFEFSMDKWIRVMIFLGSIPHQPITCEFDSEYISIECVTIF